MDAARRWFREACGDAQVVDEVAAAYSRLAGLWRKQRTSCKESVSSASA
jgi:myo-inositol catabolism protein IolC